MTIDALALPLDRARTKLFTSALRVGALRGLLVEKRRRIPALLGLHALIALIGSVFVPSALLVLGPLLLGVPHLISDLRYLVLRARLRQSARVVLLGGSALLLAVRGAHELGLHGALRLELLAAGALSIGACLVAARAGARGRVLAGLGFALAFAAVGWFWPRATRLTLAHGHNLVALGLWVWGFARHRDQAVKLSLVGVGVGVALVATPLAWYGFKFGLRESFGLHTLGAADALAPGVQDVTLALGVVASFAFLQSLHYAVWLHAIPQEETRGDATLSFRMSLRQLSQELSRGGLALVALLVVALPLSAAAGSAHGARELYLSLSSFHAYLELAAALAFFVARVRPSSLERPPCS